LDQVCKGGLIFGTGTTQIVSVGIISGVLGSLTSGPGVKVFPRWLTASQISYQTSEGIAFTGGVGELRGAFQAPDWAPDQRTMIFHRETDHRGDLDRDFQSWRSPDPLFGLLRVPDASSFAPAGDRMVYMLTNFNGPIRSGTLVVANADGSGRRVIYEGPLTEDATGPAWSPRGDIILFGLGGFFQRAQIKSAQVMSIHSDGTTIEALTQGDMNNGMPSWSPDGKQVVYRIARGTTRQLHILDVDTKKSRSRKLETGSDFETFPAWSPRGDWIAFTSKRDGDYDIFRIKSDGTGLRRLTHSRGNDAHPAFSPDGKWIAFSTARHGFKDEAVQLLLSATFQPYGEIAVMRIDGSDVRILTDNSTEEGAPSWVPGRTQ
jgi:Tol biopolymer transport system component